MDAKGQVIVAALGCWEGRPILQRRDSLIPQTPCHSLPLGGQEQFFNELWRKAFAEGQENFDVVYTLDIYTEQVMDAKKDNTLTLLCERLNSSARVIL
jgi:hypothetical protein